MACANDRSHHAVLAENKRVGNVTLCGCGTIHLSVGAVSMRLSPDTLIEVNSMLQAAVARMMQRSEQIEVTSGVVQ